MSNTDLTNQFLIYQASDGDVKLDVRLQDETIWLTINQMAELFGVDKSGISRHLKNIFERGELLRDATVANFATVQTEGDRSINRELEYFNLDAIISVGYRVNSVLGTQFRIWATKRLNEYIVKGFTMDDARLKEAGNSRYFEELLTRIRDIRSSEKVFWRKVLDIYATSSDYDPKSDYSLQFFKQIQNKMHWAAHGHTAAELIYQRADANQDNMGITNYSGNKLLKRDSEVAKNYLNEDELSILNRMVTAYLEMAELQAMSHVAMDMRDWIERLDQFLTMTGRELLTNAGTVSHQSAIDKAHAEYEIFKQKQLEKPSEVEKHFIEAERQLKQLETSKEQEAKKTK